jgi:multiple sugar transport system substrate-binding protein
MMKGSSCLVLVLLLAMFLAFGSISASAASQYAGETITVFQAEQSDIMDPLRDLVPEFERETGIKVILETVPEGQSVAKQQMILASGSDKYDVFRAASIDAVGPIEAGWFVPIDKLLGANFDYSDFPSRLLDLLSHDGKLYGLPIRAETIILMYRKDLFQKYGVKVPKTFDELTEAARILTRDTNNDGKTDLFGTAVRGAKGQGGYPFTYYLRNMGGRFFDKQMRPTVNSDAAVEALKYYVKLASEYAPHGSTVYTWEDVFASMQLGRTAFIIESSIQAGKLENPDNSLVVGKVGYSVPPAGPGGNFPDLKTNGYFVSSFSKHKGAAAEFVKWATGKRFQQYAFDRYKFAALTRKSVMDYASNKAPFFKAIKETMDQGYIYYLPPIAELGQLYMTISDAVSRALAGTQKPEEALRDANQQIEKIMREAGYYDGKKNIPKFIKEGNG